MKISFYRLALPGLVVLASVGLFGSQALSGPTRSKAEDPRLRALMTQKRDLLRQLETDREAQFQVGTATTEQVEKAVIAVIQADLELAQTRRERIALRQKSVDVATKIEESTAVRYRAATVTQTEWQEAQLARLEAEIALEREKNSK